MKNIVWIVGFALLISYYFGQESHNNRYYESNFKTEKTRAVPIAIQLKSDGNINRYSSGYSYRFKPSYETELSDYEKNAIWSEYTPTWTVEQRLRASNGYDP